MKSLTTKLDIQMRFADVDILGHVNNVNLQHYFDLGKSDFFGKAVGTEHLVGSEGILTANTTTSYFAQTRLGEKIYVETSVKKIGNKSITLYQRVLSSATQEVKAESRSVMVAFDFESQESITVPDKWREILTR